MASETEIERAYQDGVTAERLKGHDEHLARINGSIERNVVVLEAVVRGQDRIGEQVTGLLILVPKVQTVAEAALAADVQASAVAEALAAKTEAERTNWDRWRNKVAWTLGSAIGLIALCNSLLLLAAR